jgi:hypothetical protein
VGDSIMIGGSLRWHYPVQVQAVGGDQVAATLSAWLPKLPQKRSEMILCIYVIAYTTFERQGDDCWRQGFPFSLVYLETNRVGMIENGKALLMVLCGNAQRGCWGGAGHLLSQYACRFHLAEKGN